MKIADFRIQTTPPDAPSSSSVIGVYANASGVLVSHTSAGVINQVGAVFTGSSSAIANTGGAARLFTGVTFGGNGSATATGLANPAIWLGVQINGSQYYLPAYS
jgi:hypothetical protein